MAKRKNKRYKVTSLNKLSNAATAKEKIDISNQDSIKANRITIIKRDGRKQPFQPNKLMKLALWACSDNEHMAEELIRDTEIKLHKEIRIQDMFQQLIVTAVNKISMLQTLWEDVSAKLELMKIYKETYNIKSSTYPSLIDFIAKGIEHKIYDKETIAKFSLEEIEELNKFIQSNKDLLFNYKGLTTFFNKYCLNYSKTKKLELPQMSYMRVAMALMAEEEDKVKYAKDEYEQISNHNYTRATPIMLNALTAGQQLSSCVLNTLDDDSHSILDTGKNLGIYSKFKGGTALDISSMRAKGGYIEGTQGYSSGPVPFMKFYESIMKAWNQGGKRPGALAVYFNWWHLDVIDLLSLKSNGGTDENRARGLQYAIKLNDLFIEAVEKDQEIYLFDPKDTPLLVGLYGEAFNKIYYSYAAKTNVRKKSIKAKDLWEKIFKERSETGNIYLYHEENVNEQSLLNRYIGSSNLCLAGDTEVQTNNGVKNLKDIEIGDLVKSYNTSTKKIELKKVTDSALMNKSAEVMKITDVTGNYIICTPDHKVFTENRGYVMAKDLKENDHLNKGEIGSIDYLEEEIEVYDITVEDNHNFYANNILVHNCTEITLPSRASKNLNEELVKMEAGEHRIVKRYTAGEIALCNLSSVNLERWFYMSEEEKWQCIRTLVRGLDNTVDVANYPVKEGKHSNMMYRYLGIGVLNYTNYMALNKIVIDTQECAEETDKLMDELSYMIISVGVELAIEKGKFPKFHETEWAKGILPIDKANKNAFKLTKYKHDEEKWDKLREKVKVHGVRNAQYMAIAPTACQTKVSKIRTANGDKSLEQIMNEQDIDHKSIENNGVQAWFDFKCAQEIPTRFGNKEVTKIWYNGKVPTRKITLEDGNIYEFSLNHKLLVKLSDGSEYWEYVQNLKENMEIVEI